MRCPARRSARRSRCSPRTASTSSSRRDDGFTPTPVISRAILAHNRGRTERLADGIVITPSHNPPEDGGFKYNPPNGGPADTDVTSWIQDRANALLRAGNRGRASASPLASGAAARDDARSRTSSRPYVDDLRQRHRHGGDPRRAAEARRRSARRRRRAATGSRSTRAYGLDIDVVNPTVDPTFSFMTVDHDGKIRMDCSSPYAMASLVGLKDRFDVAFANDPDADRHGIVTPSAGLMNPNHYLAVAIRYLLTHRPQWPRDCGRRQDARLAAA